MGVFIRYFEVVLKALKGSKVLFCGHGPKLLLLLRGTSGFMPFSHINHWVVLREHKVYAEPCSIPYE